MAADEGCAWQSMRSVMPPWPGMESPKSLILKPRLKPEAKKPPKGAMIDANIASTTACSCMCTCCLSHHGKHYRVIMITCIPYMQESSHRAIDALLSEHGLTCPVSLIAASPVLWLNRTPPNKKSAVCGESYTGGLEEDVAGKRRPSINCSFEARSSFGSCQKNLQKTKIQGVLVHALLPAWGVQ